MASVATATSTGLSGSIVGITHGPNLWQAALDSLPPEIQASFGLAKTHKRDTLAAVLQAAEDKRQLCLRKRWKFKRSNGEEVILRDVVEKITRWVNVFKAVGDTAVQFDTTGASLPWAAVRFLLQTAVNDVQLLGAMITDLEVISRLIARCREFEDIHLSRTSPMESMLREALTRMYTEVLVHLASIISYFSESTIVRLAKGTFRTADNDQMQKIRVQEQELLKLAQLSDTQTLHLLETALVRLTDQASLSARNLDQEKYMQLLKWLSISPFSRHHQLRSETRLPGTGAWLLSRPEYQNWADSSASSMLLLHGIPGSGKSTLCSLVVDSRLAAVSSQPLAAPFAYFYCADSEFEPERTSPDEIFRSLLRQLAINRNTPSPTVRDFLWSAYELCTAQAKVDGLDMTKLRAKGCLDLLLTLAGEDPLTIIIDAVDEINDSDRYTLLSTLSRLVDEADNVVKIFLTSRNDTQIFKLLPTTAQKINITSQDTKSDVETFVRHLIDEATTQKRLLNGDLPPELSSVILETLSIEAGEMFLWAKLQIDQLCHKKHANDIHDALTSPALLPKIDELYQQALDRIFLEEHSQAQETAISVFHWLLYMKEPLTPAALVTAVTAIGDSSPASSPSSTSGIGAASLSPFQLLNLCSNLVIIDTKCNVVRFAHRSVQEFLRTKAKENENELSLPYGHQRLAGSCLEICSRGPPSDYTPSASAPFGTDTFYPYAVAYWAEHCAHAYNNPFFGTNSRVHQDCRDSVMIKQMKAFIFDTDDGFGDGGLEVSLSFDIWLDSARELAAILPDDHDKKPALDACQSTEIIPLFVAATFGIVDLVEFLAASTSDATDWDQRNDQGHTAVYLAAANGHHNVLYALLEEGADPDIACGKYGNALHAACFNGHEDVVNCFLNRNAPTATLYTGTKFANALEAAFRGGHENIALLLLDGVSPWRPIVESPEAYEAALQGASLAGFLRVIDKLQTETIHTTGRDRNARIPAQDSKIVLKTAKAIKGGQLGVLRKFLQTKSNSDPRSLLPAHAVALATLHGHTDLVAYLLDLSLDIEAPGPLGPPLRTACILNHERIACLLLDRGANPNPNPPPASTTTPNNLTYHSPPLIAASFKGHTRLITLLLNHGALVNHKSPTASPSNPYGTALQAAAYHGQLSAVVLLLDAGAEVHISGLSEDAFHAAAEGGHYDIVAYLLGRGYRFKDRPPGRQYMRHFPQSKELLRDASPGRVDWRRDWAVDHHYAAWGRRRTARLEQLHGEKGELAKAATSRTGAEEEISAGFAGLGLGKRSGTGAVGDDGDDALVAALTAPSPVKGYEKERHWRGGDHHILEASAAAGNLRTVEVLLQSRQTLGISEREFDEAVYVAVQNGKLEIVSRLFGHLVEKNQVITNQLKEAMQLACRHGHESMREYLLGLAARHCSDDTLDQIREYAHAMERFKERYAKADLTESEVVSDLNNACSEGDMTRTAIILDSESSFRHLSNSKSRLSNGFRLATTAGHQEIVRFLIEHPNLSPGILRASAAFQWAAGCGKADVVGTILPHLEDDKDFTEVLASALAIASQNGHVETVMTLLRYAQSDPNTLATVIAPPKFRFRQMRKRWGGGAKSEESNDFSAPEKEANQDDEDQDDDEDDKRGSIFSRGRQAAIERVIGDIIKGQSSGEKTDDNVTTAPKTEKLKRSAFQRAVAGFGRFDIDNKKNSCLSDWLLSDSEEDQETIVSLLLERGADPNSPGTDRIDRDGFPIQIAARYAPISVIRKLIAAGADVNARHHNTTSRSGKGSAPRSALEWAVGREAESVFFVRALIESGAVLPRSDDLDGVMRLLNRALVYFASRDGSRSRSVFTRDGYFRESHSLQELFDEGPAAVVEVLLGHYPDMKVHHSEKYGLLLQIAAFIGRGDYVGMLIDRGFDVNVTGNYYGTVLQAAARSGHVDIARNLLGAGARVNILQGRHHTPIRAALAAADVHTTKLLLEHGADIDLSLKGDEPPQTALQLAAGSNACADIVRLLLGHGADASHEDAHNKTQHPLVLYSAAGNVDAIRILLDAGAPVNVSGNAKRNHPEDISPLHAACHGGHVEIVKVLLQYGADVHNTNEITADTPLLVACRQGHLQIVQLLLDAGAQINSGSRKRTPLSEAALNGHVEVVRTLLGAGAEAISSDPPLKNALAAACCSRDLGSKSSKQVLELLLEDVMDGAGRTIGSGNDNDDDSDDDEYNPEDVIDGAIVSMMKREDKDKDADYEAAFLCMLQYLPHSPKYLVVAAAFGSTAAVRMFLDEGMDVITVGDEVSKAFSPLHMACAHLRSGVVRLLLEHGADPDGVRPGTVMQAESDGEPNIIKAPLLLALERCAAPGLQVLEREKERLGMREARRKRRDIVEVRVDGTETGSSDDGPSEDGAGDFENACTDGDEKDGSAPSQADNTAHEAMSRKEVSPSENSEEDGEDDETSSEDETSNSDSDDNSESSESFDSGDSRAGVLHAGISAQQKMACEEIVRLLLDHGAKHVPIPCGDYGTPLHLASFVGSETIVHLLLSKGADVNTVGGAFETPLFAALEGEHSSLIPLLLEEGADLTHRHEELGTPLYHACKKDCVNSVRSMLEHGADPGAIAKDERETTLESVMKNDGWGPRLTPPWEKDKEKDTVLDLLLGHIKASDTFRLRDEDIAAATSSLYAQKHVLNLLELDPNYVPSEKAVLSMLGNRSSPGFESIKAVMERNPELGISSAMLMMEGSHSIMEQLFEMGRPVCKITCEIMEAQKDAEAVELLLDRCENIVSITEKTVLVVLKSLRTAWNRGKWVNLLEKMWHRDPSLAVTEPMLKAAQETADMEFLLARYKQPISESVIESACSHIGYIDKDDLLRVVLNYYCGGEPGSRTKTTARIHPGVVARALKYNEQAVNLLDIFLEYDAEIPVTEDIFVAVFGDTAYQSGHTEERWKFAQVLKKYKKKMAFTDKMRELVETAYQEESLVKWREWWLGGDPVWARKKGGAGRNP